MSKNENGGWMWEALFVSHQLTAVSELKDKAGSKLCDFYLTSLWISISQRQSWNLPGPRLPIVAEVESLGLNDTQLQRE
jgi:hypothetical protein